MVSSSYESALQEITEEHRKEKRPRLFSPGRLGSPPPELPNHDWILELHHKWCKRHFGNSVSRKLTKVTRLLLPSLAGVGGGPDFRGRSDDSALLASEFQADDISRERSPISLRNDPHPMGARIG